MSAEVYAPLVAKFGGTSMASPEVVMSHLEVAGDSPDVVVVSAPGKDETHKVKTTDMLLGYKKGAVIAEEIQRRFEDILLISGSDTDPACQAIVDNIPTDLSDWTDNNDPVEALGEHWSARLFAAQTGREFVDAREIIFFDNNGSLNETATNNSIRSRLSRGGHYIVPGYYGLRADGHVQAFPRGGSDITGAVIARALQARQYDNWSNVDGFMSADPEKIANARFLDLITYREARELSNGGAELLHRTVIKLLGHSGIKTVMRNTFGTPGNSGTEVVSDRAWQWQPVVAVTGRDDMLAVSLHEFGLNEEIGGTADLYAELEHHGIPYEHAATGTDDVSLFIAGFKQYRDKVSDIIDTLKRPGRRLEANPAGLVHVVGEGLARSGTDRLRTLGLVATALAEEGVQGRGGTDVGASATLTLFVKPEAVTDAVRIAHSALKLDE